jgi:sialate O-acetylesterase
MKKINLFSGVALFAMGVFGAVELASPFADGMVLQRDTEVPVWGTAAAGEAVTVSFAGAEVKTVAAADGSWKVKLPKMSASKESRTLKANEVEIKDVLVGEVWFCAGQSNTELPLVSRNPRFFDRQGGLVAQMTDNPYLRFVHASNYRWSGDPKKKAPYKVEWKKFTPENLGGGKSFSAMGVYFVLDLYAALEIPIGIVGTYWGGTRIEPWTPRCGLEMVKGLERVATQRVYKVGEPEVTPEKGKKYGKVIGHQQPTVLWNEMVESWCPMAMRGFIWYQGCSNAKDGDLYRLKMKALREGWAKKFEREDLKLYFVQLAPFIHPWYEVQLAQAAYAAEDKHAGMVTTCDIGNLHDIHPSEKGTIGKRLAALALKRDYGFEKIKAEVPVLKSAVLKENTAVLSFDNAGRWWYVYSADRSLDVPFELADETGKWAKAKIVNVQKSGLIDSKDLILSADGIAKPVKVRYLYNKPWIGNVFSCWNIPIGPFESEVK